MGPLHMDASERIKGVLDGSIQPSEISGDEELYYMAERIYGREALENMGVEPPVVPPELGAIAPNGNGGVEIPNLDGPETIVNTQKKNVKGRRKLIPLIMFLCLIISSYNVSLGLGSIITTCVEDEPIQELEIGSSSQINENGTLYVVWTMYGLNNYSEYRLEWSVSQNGSSNVIETGNTTWISSESARITSRNWIIENPPYSYLSTLYEDDDVVGYSNGSGEQIITKLSENNQQSTHCADNTRLIWTEYSDLESKDAWTEAGTGDLIDGALIMMFAGLMMISARKRA
jgi:hypothetical protein|tara:strand:+ start:20191 stop:21054 length:864 start_codon:yes stop_codon:yes gene_type:complete